MKQKNKVRGDCDLQRLLTYRRAKLDPLQISPSNISRCPVAAVLHPTHRSDWEQRLLTNCGRAHLFANGLELDSLTVTMILVV